MISRRVQMERRWMARESAPWASSHRPRPSSPIWPLHSIFLLLWPLRLSCPPPSCLLPPRTRQTRTMSSSQEPTRMSSRACFLWRGSGSQVSVPLRQHYGHCFSFHGQQKNQKKKANTQVTIVASGFPPAVASSTSSCTHDLRATVSA